MDTKGVNKVEKGRECGMGKRLGPHISSISSSPNIPYCNHNPR